ncbi:protein kinase [Mycobacterium ulcerans]|uniref:Serine/threonine-protein kinase transcriptional regulatory protein PknK_2 n=1 Tax=Mycobacterium ulcerans (strain Agy99) TaxID=362242 RepID=A0PWF5_MYCUA|nr:protein kinase [Mycobacterium ulcerans]ABL06674.1 serine/threonine-protein kinase transcriptional regulatory protein PknK_2 [Mycobacterium ulcerans Agy99]MEB3904010.1 protein kinase [Mycobacterium ulcerans]MEB3908149.1 protein kinase [Mycobacterium ulcerans]MEB3918449.1 protein kinase [Mycobacterium ulcerans]MEB3922578.1 protein kinase [Mycobacterium ulcerans]
MVSQLIGQLGADGFADAVEVGRGGFGVVYRARQVELDRVVAVKVLTADLEQNRPRFEREQRAMARLTGHPNIVSVLQVGHTPGGYPYLVMPFCSRGSVQEVITECGGLAVSEVLRLGVAVAAGLESAHRLGIVHRDVKPANVLLTELGDPAVTDFGIAHMVGGFHTASGVFSATPDFTAPEVLSGKEPDQASDVYGLGATLFCALTGQPPFARRDGEVLMAQLLRIATKSAPDLRAYGVDDDLAVVIGAALAPEPTARPAMVEFGEALQELQATRGLAIDAMALQGAKHTGKTAAARPVPPPRVRGNLPAPLSEFVGRAAELAALAELFSTARLVTLVGVGGVGKTTLALRAARTRAADYPAGVWVIDIGELRDGALLPGLAAGALGIHDQGSRALPEVMVDAIGEREMLLVFDNCEHVIDEAAALIDTLLRGCPRLQIVATSRELLSLDGEAVFAVSPLRYPDTTTGTSRAALADYDAVALFVERAQAARPGFTLTEHNAGAIALICSRLDGVPLAVELAAARVRAMSVQQIAARLSESFALLSRGYRGSPTHQQTLRCCIDWSYQRCSTAEQQLWARLSVFAGSFDLDLAHHVCAPDTCPDDLLDQLCELVDKSILSRIDNNDDAEVRFRLLATPREYGASCLTAADHQLLRQRHLDGYRQLVAKAHAEWFSEHQVNWIRRMRRELPNVQEALQFGLTHAPDTALEMVADLRMLFIVSGKLKEGRRWLDRALSATPESSTKNRIRGLTTGVGFAYFQMDWPAVTQWLAEARNLLELEPYPEMDGLLCGYDGFSTLLRGEIDQARVSAERGLAITGDYDDYQVRIGCMWVMSFHSALVGDADQALHWAERAYALAESRHEVQMRTFTVSALVVGWLTRGGVEHADSALRKALELCRASDYPFAGAQCLEGMAWTSAANNNLRRAVVLMTAAATISQITTGSSTTFFAAMGPFHADCERRARAELSETEFESARIQGESLTFDEAVAFALGHEW